MQKIEISTLSIFQSVNMCIRNTMSQRHAHLPRVKGVSHTCAKRTVFFVIIIIVSSYLIKYSFVKCQRAELSRFQQIKKSNVFVSQTLSLENDTNADNVRVKRFGQTTYQLDLPLASFHISVFCGSSVLLF